MLVNKDYQYGSMYDEFTVLHIKSEDFATFIDANTEFFEDNDFEVEIENDEVLLLTECKFFDIPKSLQEFNTAFNTCIEEVSGNSVNELEKFDAVNPFTFDFVNWMTGSIYRSSDEPLDWMLDYPEICDAIKKDIGSNDDADVKDKLSNCFFVRLYYRFNTMENQSYEVSVEFD